ncbi:hypothetical protein B5M09_003119 [Aphanomyces astaci]|uniref:Kinesin-like protein n=1 Tax=Aphanomyces astaci TaxID=112090 RepID=A0A425D9L9_APHAT|nr:hypothetical protein B5M09_003119 [Aphanomyces astaci]
MLNEQNGNPGDVDFQRMIKQFRDQDHQEQPYATKANVQITICVRKRPVNKREVKGKDYDCVTCWHPKVIIHDCKLKVDGITKYLDSNAFEFDHSFDEFTSNETVYKYTAQPLIQFVFNECGRATVYGQTGSGKTHTMEGIQRQVATDIFAEIAKFQSHDRPLEVWLSFFEIYGGQCQDLLRQKRLTIREDGNGEVQIVDLDEVIVTDEAELLQIMQRGKLSLIDLAGSERGADTKSHNRQRRMESSEINKSLLALKECFRYCSTEALRSTHTGESFTCRALDSGGRGAHIPFRASKLTQVLKDSFVNTKARTVMIAAVSPCVSSADHTINTLRYADRVKEKQVSDDIADVSQVKFRPLGNSLRSWTDGGVCKYKDSDTKVDSSSISPGTSPDKPPTGNSLADLMSQAVCRNIAGMAAKDSDESPEEGRPTMDKVTDEDDDELKQDDAWPPHYAANAVQTPYMHTCITHMVGDRGEGDNSLEELHGVVQTLYEEQENLLSSHMSAIQENAQLLTEEGMLLSDVQGDAVVDYDIDLYALKLDHILEQKEHTIKRLRKQLALFRRRCQDEESASKNVDHVSFY